jgi:hypothetical protein
MKKAAMMVLLSSLTTGMAMADDGYESWTFDDFDSNDNVIDNSEAVADEKSAALRGSDEASNA